MSLLDLKICLLKNTRESHQCVFTVCEFFFIYVEFNGCLSQCDLCLIFIVCETVDVYSYNGTLIYYEECSDCTF